MFQRYEKSLLLSDILLFVLVLPVSIVCENQNSHISPEKLTRTFIPTSTSGTFNYTSISSVSSETPCDPNKTWLPDFQILYRTSTYLGPCCKPLFYCSTDLFFHIHIKQRPTCTLSFHVTFLSPAPISDLYPPLVVPCSSHLGISPWNVLQFLGPPTWPLQADYPVLSFKTEK